MSLQKSCAVQQGEYCPARRGQPSLQALATPGTDSVALSCLAWDHTLPADVQMTDIFTQCWTTLMDTAYLQLTKIASGLNHRMPFPSCHSCFLPFLSQVLISNEHLTNTILVSMRAQPVVIPCSSLGLYMYT